MSLLKFKKIIDLRSITEIIQNGKIPNSKNIPYESFKEHPVESLALLKLKKNDPILFYCRSGKRSSQIVWLTRQLGYNSFNLDLGFNFFKNHKYKFYSPPQL